MSQPYRQMSVPVSQCRHLIIVCCHAIYLGGSEKGVSEAEWLIERFQHGETTTFTEHARKGVELLAGDPASILVFSGGATKRDWTSLSEGQSYLNLTRDNNFFEWSDKLDLSHIIAETHATDSYQNVLFSLLRFRKYTCSYPSKVTVVTHAFKRERFLECHFPAIGLLPIRTGRHDQGNIGAVSVIGIDPPESVTPTATLIAGEAKRGIGLWRKDPYGVQPELARKRIRRGWIPGQEKVLFFDTGLEPVVEDLLGWDGGRTGNELFPKMEQLPWF